jgi:hypothetical protein
VGLFFSPVTTRGSVRRLGCKWEANIRIDLREIKWEAVDWIEEEDREEWRAFVNTIMKPPVL